MSRFPKTIIIRHRKENLKKCSLKTLEVRRDLLFLTYPTVTSFTESSYILLTPDSPPLSKSDRDHGLLLLDATWRLAHKMKENIQFSPSIIRRSIPYGIRTAYPRRQDEYVDPNQGLASIEALYVAYLILGRNTEGLLDHYHWKEEFLEKNRTLLSE